MNYIFYFYLLEKFIFLTEKKYYKIELDENLKKELFFNDMVKELNLNENFSLLYKKEFKNQEEINKIIKIFEPMFEMYNKLLKHENEIGNILLRAIKFLHKYVFIPFEEELNKFKKIEKFHEDSYFKSKINEENEIILLNLILYFKNILYYNYAFYNSALLDKNDISNLNENTNEWNNLEKIFFRIIPKNAEIINKKKIESRKNPDIGFSIMSNINYNDSATTLVASGLKNLVYYKANENKKKIDSKKFQIKNSLENAKELFGLFKKFKYIFTKMIPSIEFRRKIYVKKELPPITRSHIEKLINFMKGEKSPVNSSQNININSNIENLPIIFRDKVIDKKIKRNYVSLTILNNEKLYFKDEKKENNNNMFSSFFNYFKKDEEENLINENNQIINKFRKNTILIAIHGGGFIASSTLLHERYLRKWATILNIPIFGINYSLAPKYKYLEALNDVYQAYMWILNHAKDELNMDIKHIILSGDSAGGNLALGLNNLLIVMKEYESGTELGKQIILPELVSTQYPVTYFNLKNFSNSFILSLHNNMLNVKGMKFMYDQYVEKYELEDEDPFLNPVKINNFILDRTTNKIRIFFGTEDVLRGDSVKLLNVFSKYNNREDKKNKINIRGYEILYFGHGFNGFNEEIQQIGRNIIFPEIEEFLNSIS